MKSLKSQLIILLTVCFSALSCVDNLDIPPKNIITEEQVFGNEAGIDAYMAKVYRSLPMMDRCFSIKRGWDDSYTTEQISTVTGEACGRDRKSSVMLGWWNYGPVRDVNMFIETLPKYAENFSEADVQHWLGEAHFLRAFMYMAMAQRYGGVPIVTKVLNYPEEDVETFKIPRNSELDTWLQVEADFQYAIDNCKETTVKGRINRYTAAAYKAEAMMYAASIANFNEISHYDTERGYRLCGIDKEKAPYFYKSAYEAARLVEGHYSLYMNDWVEGDREAQYVNFKNIHQKPDNCENIYVREYRFPEYVHSWDALFGPLQQRQGGMSGGVCPTLELVELFEGLPKDSEGRFSALHEDGTYIMYDDIHGPFKECEPRLRATVILPCDIFKGEEIEIWRGVYVDDIPAEGLKNFTDRDMYESYLKVNDMIGGKLSLSKNPTTEPTYYTKLDGTKMMTSGKSGTFNSFSQGSYTGFLLRKNLDEALSKELVQQRRSELDWVDMRYAEVLLNRAEAAYELTQLGETVSSDGKNYMEDAAECINSIRKRAGCKIFFNSSNLTRGDIRKEFVRELAFENKCYFNLARWRIFHIRHDSNVRYHAANAFYAGKIDKWFFDVKHIEQGGAGKYTFNPINYYLAIPSGEINSNPNLIQNIR